MHKTISVSGICLSALSLSACGLPAYPGDEEIVASLRQEYRDAECKVRKIHSPVEMAVAHKDFAYITIHVEAACRDHYGATRDITSSQVWYVSKESHTLFQGARRWTRERG